MSVTTGQTTKPSSEAASITARIGFGIFRNSGYRSILAGELAIREEPSDEVVDPPIFAPGLPQ